MQSILYIEAGPAVLLSVHASMPVEDVVAVLTTHQISSVPVIDEHGVGIGVISLADLVTKNVTGPTDPIFAGAARRRWYHQPAWVTARDLMSSRTSPAGRGERERPHGRRRFCGLR